MADETGLIKVAKAEDGAFLRPVNFAEMLTPESYPNAPAANNTNEVSHQLRELWQRVLKRKWMIALIALIVTAITTVESFRDKSIYNATATVEIEKENRTLFRSGDVVIEADDDEPGYQITRSMKTKIKLVQTRPLLEDVAVVLQLEKNPEFLAVTERKGIWDSFQSIGESLSLRGKKKAAVEVPQIPDVQLEGDLLRPPEESARLAPVVDILQSNISAAPVEDTRMLAISYRHSDPKLAAAIANATANVFIQRSYRGKTSRFEEANTWLATKTRELKAKVEQAELALANYTSQHNMFSTDGKSTLTAEKLTSLHSQVMKAETDTILKKSLYEEVQQGRLEQLPEAFADAKTTGLHAKLGEMTAQMAQLRVKLGLENPRVVELSKQIAAVQKQMEEGKQTLADRLKADYERAAREEQALKAALERAKSETAQENQDNIQLSILRQDVETAKALYTDFLQKTNQANLQTANQQQGEEKMMKLIEPAQVPRTPIGPDRLRTILIGLLLSVVAGIGLALFIEFLNNTIKSVEDVTQYLGLPTLALVPTFAKSQEKLQASTLGKQLPAQLAMQNGTANARAEKMMLTDIRSAFAESYRALRTSVLLSGTTPARTILMTSSQPGEGKSTTALNAAIALSQLKVRTLLIDADMRRPSLHKVFGIAHGNGLSTYLADASGEVEIDSLIQSLPIPNLYVLPCGLIPPDPSELISSERMKDLLQQLRAQFQYIVIDSPPLINVSDPIILSTLVDGVVFVVKGGDTKRSIVVRARQELASVGAKILGVVINNLDLKTSGYDEYYYQRYHSEYKQEQAELNS